MLCLQDEIEELLKKYPDPREGEAGAVSFRGREEAGAALPCLAVVTDNLDPLGLGRIRVGCDAAFPGAVTDWVPVAGAGRGANGGGFWQLPDIGTQVLLVFPWRNTGRPVAVGCVFDRKHRPPEGYAEKAADQWVWQTGNHRVEITDARGEESLVISTAEGKMRYEASKAGGIKIINELGDIALSCGKLKIAGKAGAGFSAEKKLKAGGGENVSAQTAKGAVFDCGKKVMLKGKNVKLSGSRGVSACGKQMAKNGDKVMGFDIHKTEIPSGSGTSTVLLPHPFIGKLADKLSANVKIGGANAAHSGSLSKHDDSQHMRLAGTVKFTQNPKKEGTVTGATAASVMINGKQAAVAGSTVSTCSDTGQKDHSVVLAAGCALPMPAIINPVNSGEYERRRREQKEGFAFTALRWSRAAAEEGEDVTLSARLQGIGDGNTITFQVWKEGQDPASQIALAQIQAGAAGGGAQAVWSWRCEANNAPPDEDPRFFFTAHSAWCPAEQSPALRVRLARPRLSDPQWKDSKGNSVTGGRAGEALQLTASCAGDMEEGAGVIFRVYPEGADPKLDRPAAEFSSVNKAGAAQAQWAYRYVHDQEKPLTQKPKFFFTAESRRCKTVQSGNVEIGMEIDIPVCFEDGLCLAELEYRLTGIDGTQISGKTGRDGRIRNAELLPGNYEISIDWEAYEPPSGGESDTLDFSTLGEDCKKISFVFNKEMTLWKLRPGRDYAVLIRRADGEVSQ
jgi:uncharacterized Zn-binding protein involved in type VI secretion